MLIGSGKKKKFESNDDIDLLAILKEASKQNANFPAFC